MPLIYFILLVSFASIGAVIPSASLIEISKHFRIAAFESEKIITVFIFGYAISQILYGYISNFYGGKKALYFGATLAGCGYSICVFTNSYDQFIFGRFISALGSGCGLTVTFALIADIYKDKEARKITSYTTSAFAIMPGLATLIGSFISVHYSWRSCFIFMAIYSLLVLIIATTVPISQLSKKTYDMNLSDYICDFKKYSYAAVIWGLCGSIIYMLSATLPIISINEFHTSAMIFGLLYSLCMLGYFIGNILSANLNSRLTTKEVLYTGCTINVIAAISFVIVSYLKNLIVYYIPLFLLFISLPLIFSTLLGQAMQKVKNKSISSCIISFTCMSLSAVISTMISNIMTDLTHRITFTILGICFVITGLTLNYLRHHSRTYIKKYDVMI